MIRRFVGSRLKPATLAWLALAGVSAFATALPDLLVHEDDTEVGYSCRILIPADLVIADRNGNGVIHVRADGIRLEFDRHTVLRGAPESMAPDELAGIGIRIDGHSDVSILNARVRGFKNGLVASRANGLTVSGGDFSDNYRQRLRSTPAAEDGADWLFPHDNETAKWRDRYGAALCVEASLNVTLHDIRVRRGQNGIVLDRVSDSRVFDNDCSFLSGWGLALWKSCRNAISRNALDFCVRGHVEGVYNRGQDSAGILCFEQSSDNVIALNSATHGGDGLFGFAGREAIGEVWRDSERDRLRKRTGESEVEHLLEVPPALSRRLSAMGCNGNLILSNDFSYASAHGIEMTFSEGNRIVGNRLVENAICGLWGGYSSDTLIASNLIARNGGMAYGLERGGINMEHAANNRILRNEFINNKCAIHLWWDNDAALLKLPGVSGNDRGVSGNVIAANRFVIDARHPFQALPRGQSLVVLQLRDDGRGNVRNNRYFDNRVELTAARAVEFESEPGLIPIPEKVSTSFEMPRLELPGKQTPVGARARLRGRRQIIMGEWGPWDHESPFVRPVQPRAGEARFDLFGFVEAPRVRVLSGDVSARVESAVELPGHRLIVRADPGVHSYRLSLRTRGFNRELEGMIVATRWRAAFFPWTIDPREDLDGWRRQGQGAESVRVELDALHFPYGWGGPRDRSALEGKGPGPDRFGMIATTRLHLPAGRWRFSTLSDDGVRVSVGGKTVIENWTWHGPTRDEGVHIQREASEVRVLVEHFEIDGYATLELRVEPAD